MKKYAARSILVCALFFFSLTPALAQPVPKPYEQYFGLNGGTTIGAGMAYRYWPGNTGFQVSAAPFINFLDGSSQFTLGGAGLWTVQDLSWVRFFTYLGGAAYYSAPRGEQAVIDNTLGAGLGCEFFGFDHIAFDVMAGYGINMRRTGFNSTFSFETGLYYRM